MDYYAIIVVRSNGKDVEVLEHLFKTAEAAHEYAQPNLKRWLGVTLEVVKVTVPLQGEPVLSAE